MPDNEPPPNWNVIEQAIALAKANNPEFWKGYERTFQMSAELSFALIRVLANIPKQRLGQIIANAVGHGVDLFNLHDEDLLIALTTYHEKYGEKD